MKKAFKFIGKVIWFLFDNVVVIYVLSSCVIGWITGDFVACILATIPAVLFSIYIEVKSMAKNQKEFNDCMLDIEVIKSKYRLLNGINKLKEEQQNGE